MKLWHVLSTLAFVMFFMLPAKVQAHSVGQPPFFRVNSIFSGYYPTPLVSNKFEIPQDIAPQNYVVGNKINLEIDSQALSQSVPADIVKKTTFTWDFGDGQKATGLQNPHVYTKPGPFILKINAKYDEVSGQQLIQSILINVIPDENYQVPKVEIRINGKTSKDPLIDIFYIPFSEKINFDATGLQSQSKIIKYMWDFGDSQYAEGPSVTHAYSKDLPQQQVFPILRVVSQDGFFTDSYVQITNSHDSSKATSTTSTSTAAPPFYKSKWLYLLSPFVLILLIGFFASRKKK